MIYAPLQYNVKSFIKRLPIYKKSVTDYFFGSYSYRLGPNALFSYFV